SNSQGQSPSWTRGHHWGGSERGPRGYSQELPKYITASVFARARAAEVNAMLKAVTKTTGSAHVFGPLPKHMRRRAMSHNVKRLPRRLRAVAKKTLEKTSQQKKEQSKSKSRRARRRHGNLLLEFNRRQRKNMWLETHIWHAKRFHMVKKWGYCLGDRPTYKCYRACFRAMTNHCLLQDLSYYCCVELQGEEDKLLSALSQLTNKETGPTFAAAACLSGRRQGTVYVYKADQFPDQLLGQVLFMWRPKTGASDHRQLWIWAHPSLKQDLLTELQSVCQCSEPINPRAPEAHPAPAPCPTESAAEEKPIGKKRKRADGEGLASVSVKKIIGDGTCPPNKPVSWNSKTTGIVISDLTMEILRYRLIGPLSHCILTDTLRPATDLAGATVSSCFWWPEHCMNDNNMLLHHQQADMFQLFSGVCSTAEIPAGTVLGLTVDDPRLTIPKKRSKVMPDTEQLQGVDAEKVRSLTLQGVPVEYAESSLWDQAVRDNVTQNKISEQVFLHLKMYIWGRDGSGVCCSGSICRVPILLVQQPGKQVGEERASWGTGWDILLPKGWGMAFWVPLIYRGVRVGGLQVGLKHSQNKGTSHFPNDFPDCPAGVQFLKEQETQLTDDYKRRPPAKRPNYIKHGCLAPFCCPWQQLAEEWEIIVSDCGAEQPASVKGGQGSPAGPQGSEEACSGAPSTVEGFAPQPEDLAANSNAETKFKVLRNKKVLRQLSAWCRPISAKGQRARKPAGCPQQQQQLSSQVAASLLAAHCRSLVWTRLSLLKKGRPTLHAMICIPTPGDLQQLCKDQAYCGPLEPRHTDHFKHKVKQLKKGDHKKLHPEKTSQAPDPASAPTLTLGLWPEPLPSVTSHCSRVTLGFVTQGDFSLSTGCGEALGFVSLTGLFHMLSSQPAEKRGLVLVRNAASLQYRFAKLNIEV
ncbi:POP1 protein, partial [Amia calva]|nr:POP1 protein [Amia calva]